VIFTGRRYDTGDRAEYLRTIVRFASERLDVGPDFLQWLRGFVADQGEVEAVPITVGEPASAGDAA
jgi:hypothetical protein